MTTEVTQYVLNINQIKTFLPHRTPFLLVDRILGIYPIEESHATAPYASVGTKVIGLKNISFNEPYFQGHFPDFAIMPGVLILEAMAQTASFSLYPSMTGNPSLSSKAFQCILAGVDEARFRKPVVPGDALTIETQVVKTRGRLWSFDCVATVEGQKVAEARILAHLIDSTEQTAQSTEVRS